MKRDFDLIRALLLFFEEKPDPKAMKSVPPIAGHVESEIKYHLLLLHDAGLLRCEPVRSKTSERVIYVIPFDLTWEGHEFLEKIRNENTWRKIVAQVRTSGGVMTFNVINSIATQLALKALGGP